MFSIEQLANNIAESIGLELKLNNDQKEVIAYGTFAIIHMALSIVLVIIFGWIFGVLIEALVVSFSGSILRKYSGGVHASSPGTCATAGTIIAIILSLVVKYLLSQFIGVKLVIILGLSAFIGSGYIIFKLAPVDSAAKPIKTQKKKERMKKSSMLILGAYLAIVVLNITMYLLFHERRFLVFSLCLYGGTAWQAFTLTSVGHLTFFKIDAFLNQISIFIRRNKML